MSTYTVLIVDDSMLTRNLIWRIFAKDSSFTVIGTASNGIEAIAKVKALKPDLVTMDVEMPEVNGMQALKTIMAENPVPVIMVSNYTMEGSEIALKCIQNGAADFYSKQLLHDQSKSRFSEEEFLLRCKVALKHNGPGMSGQIRQKNEPFNQLLMQSLSQLLRIEENLAAIGEEIQQVKQIQRNFVLKFKKQGDFYICYYGEGVMLNGFGIFPSSASGRTLEELIGPEQASFHTSYFEQVWGGKEEMIHYEMDMKGVHLMFLLKTYSSRWPHRWIAARWCGQ